MELKTLFQDVAKLHLLVRAVKNPVRQKMMQYLFNHPGTRVSTLAKRLRLQQSAASLHLTILRNAGIVKAEREGQTIRYRLVEKRLQQVALAASKLVK